MHIIILLHYSIHLYTLYSYMHTYTSTRLTLSYQSELVVHVCAPHEGAALAPYVLDRTAALTDDPIYVHEYIGHIVCV